jgi:hypothetical protein
MVTDRCSTMGLLFVLSGDYTKYDDRIGFPIFRLVSYLKMQCAPSEGAKLSHLGVLLFSDISGTRLVGYRFTLVSNVFDMRVGQASQIRRRQ